VYLRKVRGLSVAVAVAIAVALGLAASAALSPTLVRAQDLPADTLAAWDAYVARTEARIEDELRSKTGFLVLDFLEPAERARCEEAIRKGTICISKRETLSSESKRIDVPGGLVHHWYGSVLVPGVKLDRVLDWVQTYDDRDKFYPEVEESRLLSRRGDDFHIYLRLKRTKILTAHYATEHDVTYRRYGAARASSRSVATRIRELEDPGTERERELPPDKDRGFLWRLNSYWRFEERDGGTLVECESLSLSRPVPQAVAWLVRSFIRSVPRESLESTLLPLRDYLKPAESNATKR
jgi:hypothetical protein